MLASLFALTILGTALPIHTQEVPRLMTVKTAKPGDTVTLHCAAKKNDDKFHWYKQAPGYIPLTVAARVQDSITIYPPFNLTFIVEGVSDFSLRISNVTKGDEANYFCRQRFFDSWINGTFLSVKDLKDQRLDIREPNCYVAMLVHRILLACCLLVILILSLTRNKKQLGPCCP
ncbi:unnamed protein product [Arctogadus glacialis]